MVGPFLPHKYFRKKRKKLISKLKIARFEDLKIRQGKRVKRRLHKFENFTNLKIFLFK